MDIRFIKCRNNRLLVRINGVPLSKACESMGVCYGSLNARVKALGGDKRETLPQVLADMLANRGSSRKYYVQGVPLGKVCRDLGLNYDTLFHRTWRGSKSALGQDLAAYQRLAAEKAAWDELKKQAAEA